MSALLSFCNLPADLEGRHGKPTLEVEKVRLKDWLALQCSVIIVLFHFPGEETQNHKPVQFNYLGSEDMQGTSAGGQAW